MLVEDRLVRTTHPSGVLCSVMRRTMADVIHTAPRSGASPREIAEHRTPDGERGAIAADLSLAISGRSRSNFHVQSRFILRSGRVACPRCFRFTQTGRGAGCTAFWRPVILLLFGNWFHLQAHPKALAQLRESRATVRPCMQATRRRGSFDFRMQSPASPEYALDSPCCAR